MLWRSDLRHVAVRERQLDVLVHRQVVEQVIALEDEADVRLLQRGTLLLRERVDRLSHEQVLAAPGAVVHAEDVEQRRLAGAGRPHDRDELACLDVERDAAQHEGLTGPDRERLLDALERHERGGRVELRWFGESRGGRTSEDHVVCSLCEPGRDQSLCRTVLRNLRDLGIDLFSLS